MADLSELLARLNGHGTPSPGAGQAGGQYHAPTVSSPIFSPPINGAEPHHPSAVMSPNMEQGNATQPTPQQQSAQLLNLLRFNSSRSVSQPSVPPHQRQVPRSVSSSGPSHPVATGLAASIMGKATQPTPQAAPTTSVPAKPEHAAENPQDLLLRLLNQPKPAQTEPSRASFTFSSSPSPQEPETAVDDLAQDLADATLEQVPSDPHSNGSTNSPMRVFGSNGHAQATSFEPEPAPVKPIFTYVNPFDKLEAASPRTRTPVSRSAKSPAPKVEILKPKHGLDPSTGSDNSKDQPKQKSRKLSPGPSDQSHETVAEAVANLGAQVDQQVEEALANAESKSEPKSESEAVAEVMKEVVGLSDEEAKAMEEVVVETAVEIKKELEGDQAVSELKEAVGEPLAEALKEVASDIAQADVADNWEEDGSTKDDEQTVIVYLLPMQPWASITVDNMPQRRATFRPELFMDIARLKKDFDQIDRSLVAATKNFIVYALVKRGGFRIIKQENGQYRQVFENHQERIFNIALCDGGYESKEGVESILAIGVNGSVFWTSLDPSREDQFSDNLDSQGLVLPPSPTQDDNTSGGQLKTRAKPSSRHPEFFAVGRGKSIHIVWPKVAAEYVRGGKGVCQTEKYLKERSLKILTGKAGKDFTFSEDDSVIVSLDKAGRMRFWDIRSLTNPELGFPNSAPRQIEVSDTLLEFHTTSPTAKSWPTSVFFFDKEKPFKKGIALRYVMVGMKQNHSFQLWDLALGKAVQEINLPHEKESDAICSAAFHASTGIMAVAHPTRNSIFFIHISCPRYNLPPMSQASYLQRLASKNEDGQSPLPAVNATAIMTSISEYSFAPKGQIRSIHMLSEPAGPPDVDEPEHNAVFELYVMHSKGVCTVRIRRSDLGWKKENEPLQAKKAKDEGIITVTALKPPQLSETESSNGGETPRKTASERSTRESVKKESSNVSRQSMTPEAAMRASTLAKVESKQDAQRAAIINGGEKSEKKKKKRATADTVSQASSATRTAAPSYSQAAQAPSAPKSPTPPESTVAEPATAQPTPSQSTSSRPAETEADELMKKLLNKHLQQSASVSAAAPAQLDLSKIGDGFQAQVAKELSTAMDGLYKRMDEERRVAKASGDSKQDALLRLVSSTLTDNIDGVIRKMVEENMRDVLLPKMLEQTTSAVEKSIGHNFKQVMGAHLAKEVPDAVSKAFKNVQFQNAIAESVSKKVTSNVDQIIAASTGSVLNPALASLTTMIDQKMGDQLRQAEKQREADAAKISQLTSTVLTLHETVQSMTANQAELLSQFAKLQQHLAQPSQVAAPAAAPRPAPSAPAPPKKTPEQLEVDAITHLLQEGQYEQGTMKWLQSNRTSDLFNQIFVNCNPAYLREVSPLLNLSTGAVVTDDLDQNLKQRLLWLDAVLVNVNPRDPETQDIIPKIMEIMNQRLTQAYIKLNESTPGNPLLRHISSLVSKVNELNRAVTGPHHMG